MHMEDFEDQDIYALDDGELETQNRLRNLMWTVSGDYSLDTQLDYASFRRSKYVSFYDAVKQGAFARYFDKDALAMYLLKKVYLGADQMRLTDIAQLCVDSAVYPEALKERPGVKDIREKAFSYLLDHRFQTLSASLTGRIKIAFMRSSLNGDWTYEERIREPLEKIRALGEDHEGAALSLIRVIDELYNTLVDPGFAEEKGTLEQVLAVSPKDMQGGEWQKFLEEEAYEALLEQAASRMAQDLTAMDTGEGDEEEQDKDSRKRRIVQVDQEAVSKMYSYIEKNYGRSYLSERESKAINYRLCKGAHADCSLYYTEGILENPVMNNAQYVRARKHRGDNHRYYLNHRRVTKQNIDAMAAFLKRSLELRSQREQRLSDHGSIIPNRVWRVGRLDDPGKLFYQTTKHRNNEFAVQVLIDASGSQQSRQSQVALQAYIISRSLSRAGFPHEITSFCTFWDYTVLQRFRRFDDPDEADEKIWQYTTSSNNRDGLAVRAAGDALAQRPEENKILIVLSDGRPNDVIVGRPGSRNPAPYTGEYALKDTAHEVRALRSAGIYVLGVFTGIEKDLAAEKKIFGKDFAYIRDIRNFSRVVSAYLGRLLEQDLS